MNEPKSAPYAGFLETLIDRFDQQLARIQVEHGFEYGDEFEIAVCNVLRSVLPGRVGVCRGYVVGQDGSTAGDDIILFDRTRFPTLRLLGENLSLKERVPADAVLAYIEAKYTLYLEDGTRHKGQSLRKAVGQIKAVKEVARRPVALNQIGGVTMGEGFNIGRSPGMPLIKNPYVAAIWAPKVNFGGFAETVEEFLTSIHDTVGSLTDPGGPDVVAAGEFIATPSVLNSAANISPRPMLAPGGLLIGSRHEAKTLGLALFQLLWAIEEIELAPMPWSTMMTWELRKAGFRMAAPPTDGKSA